MKQLMHIKNPDSRWNWYYKVSGAAALFVGVLFLMAWFFQIGRRLFQHV